VDSAAGRGPNVHVGQRGQNARAGRSERVCGKNSATLMKACDRLAELLFLDSFTPGDFGFTGHVLD